MKNGLGRPQHTLPSHGQVVMASVTLAAAASVLFSIPSFIRGPLGFLLMGVVPGWILGRVLLSRTEATRVEMGMCAIVLSAPVVIIARSLADGIGITGNVFVLTWAAVCLLGALVTRRAPRAESPSDPVAWILAAGLAAMVIVPAMANPVIRTWGDAMFHMQFANEIGLRGIPPQHPAFAGMPASYMWWFHVWVVALAESTGSELGKVFIWVNGAMMFAFALAMYRLASLYWPRLSDRRVAPVVVVLGMNALGWLTMIASITLSVFVGDVRGTTELREAFTDLFVAPTAGSVSRMLIWRAYFILSSFLFKYLSVTALATALSMIAVGFTMASVYLRNGGRGRVVTFGIVCLSTTAIHPLVGLPAGLAYVVGALLTRPRLQRGARGLHVALASVIGILLAAVPILYTLGNAIGAGERTSLRPNGQYISALIQAVMVLAIPAYWGWRDLSKREKELARFCLGVFLTFLVMVPLVDYPYVGEAYLVYLAYFALAPLGAGGIAAAVNAMRRRGHAVLPWVIAGVVFLPGPILQVQGFARQSWAHSRHGYPRTADEIAVFDHLRDESPVDAVVVDAQVFYSPASSAYSGRRAFFGGMQHARLVGFPESAMQARERAITNLFFDPDLADETRAALDAIDAPVYVVARRNRPPQMELQLPEDPIPDPVTKLDGLPSLFEPILRTPGITLYRYRPARDSG